MFMLAALLMLSTADANAQGFLKKLKQKAQAAVSSITGTENEDSEEQQDADSDEPADPSNLTVAQGSDECSDAEMEAQRQKWENKIQDMFGLTKEEFAILNDENASEAKKEPIRQKMLSKIMGTDGADMAEMKRFEQMSEKEQEAYIKAHPDFMQKMMKIGQNAGNFAKKANQMTAAINSYAAKMGKLTQDYVKVIEREEQQVRLLATAYNRSLSASWQSLCKMQHERHFHTDVIKTRSTRFYCYADIAAQWFSKKVSRKTEK